jgi:MFS family permease
MVSIKPVALLVDRNSAVYARRRVHGKNRVNIIPESGLRTARPGYYAACETGTMARCFPNRPPMTKLAAITHNPMTSQERRTVASLAALYCFRMLGLFMVLPLLALYTADMPGATPTLIGLALGIYGLTNGLLQIPFGWLSDRAGRRPVIISGLLLFALGSVIAATAGSIDAIILGRTLQGAGAISSTLMALVADSTREEQRTKAMAVVGMSIGLSFALALVLGPMVATLGGLPAVFWLTAALAVSGIALVILVIPPSAAAVGFSRAAAGSSQRLIQRGWGDLDLVRLNFGVFVLHFILVAFFLVVPALIEQILGVERERHWVVYLPVLLLSLAGMVPLIMLAERAGRLRPIFLLGIALVFVAIATLGYTASALLCYAALWLFFVGFNYLEATLPSLLSKAVAADSKGTAMGVFSTCQFMGAFAGGAGGGWLLEHMGNGMLTSACLLLAAAWWLIVALAPGPGPAKQTTPSPLPGI